MRGVAAECEPECEGKGRGGAAMALTRGRPHALSRYRSLPSDKRACGRVDGRVGCGCRLGQTCLPREVVQQTAEQPSAHPPYSTLVGRSSK